MTRDIYSKIKGIDELTNILEDLRKENKKIVHCHGVFDLLHPGHLKHFEAAKKKGDVLVVTITKDKYVNRGPGRPIFNHNLRAESVAAIECVDYVTINEWPTAVETIKRLKPHFYVKGSDYSKKEDDVTGKIYDEEEAIKSVGGMFHFTDEITYSSSSLINTFLAPYPVEAKDFLLEFKKRFSERDVKNVFKSVENLKILVVGDVIIDEYHYCSGMGKSAKDNIIATRYLDEEVFAGGVLAAANHLAGFCKNVTLLTALGTKNNYTDFINSHLKNNIKKKLFSWEGVPTVVKRRFVDPSFINKLFEICYLDETHHLPAKLEAKICDYLKTHLKEFDLVLLADFGHGLITQPILKVICEKARFLAVNVQTNSANLGFNLITKLSKADYICIDEPEIRLACSDKFSNLEQLILKVSKQIKCDKIIITRGHKGALVYSKKEGFKSIPVFSKEIVDRIGAGDAYFSLTSPCVFKNIPIELVGFIGNAVGALKVLIVGNRSAIEPGQFFKYSTTLLK